MELSELVNNVSPSPTRHLYNLGKQFNDTIDLTLGDPDLPPILPIKQAACKCINAGKTRYSSNAGMIELREKISVSVNRDYGVASNYENIIVTVGGMEALYLTFLSILNKDDEVLVFAPYYVNYVEMIKMCYAKPVIINTYEANDFEVSRDKLESFITSKTKAVIINNPNNPTGHVYSERFLNDLAEIVKKYDLFVITDEVYKDLVYEKKFKSIFTEISDNYVLIDSFSKKHCMTGWRIGYAVGSEYLIAAMTKLQENVAACAPVVSQYAALEALNYKSPAENLQEFRCRRDLVIKKLSPSEKLKVITPQGAFYAFVNIKNAGMKSMQFCEELLKEYHVAVAPGIAYGNMYDDYIRIAYTLSCDKLEEGVNRLLKFVSN